MQPANPALVASPHAGAIDEESFTRLIESEWKTLVRMARSVVGDADAEDIVQEGLLVAWNKRHRLRDPNALGAWVQRIVFRRCLRLARRRRILLPLSEARLPAEAGPAPSVVLLLQRLSPRQRAVMHLTVIEGMTDSEIAPLLGMRPATVRTHRRRARERLREMLREEGDPR